MPWLSVLPYSFPGGYLFSYHVFARCRTTQNSALKENPDGISDPEQTGRHDGVESAASIMHLRADQTG